MESWKCCDPSQMHVYPSANCYNESLLLLEGLKDHDLPFIAASSKMLNVSTHIL